MTIQLNEKQQKLYDSTLKLCTEIEGRLAVTIEPDDAHQIAAQLENIRPYLANCPMLMANATVIYDWAKGEAADSIIIDSKLMNCKQSILNGYITGKLAKYSALYARCESLERNLRSSVEGLRSLLSYQKELARDRN